jgi:hypothetical protein
LIRNDGHNAQRWEIEQRKRGLGERGIMRRGSKAKEENTREGGKKSDTI